MQSLPRKEYFPLNLEQICEEHISQLLNFISNYFFSVVILISDNEI